MADKVTNASSKKSVTDSPELNFYNQAFVKEIEAKNRVRAQKLLNQRFSNRLTAGFLAFGVLSIYGYTIYAMRQETFLDDFNEPEKVHD